jgi:zinc transporter, ZIP family
MDMLIWILIVSVMGPVIGSLIGVIKKPSERFMLDMLAFAAGVMLAISFLELIPQSLEMGTVWSCAIGIIIGSIVMYIVDKTAPHIHPCMCVNEQGSKLKKTAVYLLIGIFIHNLPEGMAIATGTISGMDSALVVALAIAIHNIPEGICTSAPFYFCSKKRLKSFLISASTAIPILAGFFIGKALYTVLSPIIISGVVAATAGVMIYISGDELIPTSCNKSNKPWSHSTIFSLIAGVLFVVVLGSL